MDTKIMLQSQSLSTYKSIVSFISKINVLTLQEAASGMHPEWQGGQILPAPIKTSLEAILTQFFDITLIGGQK